MANEFVLNFTGEQINESLTLVESIKEKGIINMSAANAGAHNAIYRGKYLGNTITQAQYDVIAAGTFDDLFVGDYWTINEFNFRIAAFDYYYGTGSHPFNKHHVVIVPDTVLGTAVMNDTETTAGGYVNTRMRSFFLGYAWQLIPAYLGDHLLTHEDYLTTEYYGGYGQWYEGTIELMTEQNVYGTAIYGNSNQPCRTVNNSQYPLFRFRPDLIRDPTTNYWLRDIASVTEFAMVCTLGNCDKASANENLGIRPSFAIG